MKAKFSILCDVILLVMLQEKFEIDHFFRPSSALPTAEPERGANQRHVHPRDVETTSEPQRGGQIPPVHSAEQQVAWGRQTGL